MTSNFNFTGTLLMPKEGSKRPFCRVGTTKNNSKSLAMTFGIKEGQNNVAFVEAFDFERDVIRTMNTNKGKIEIAWEDRNNADIVSQVAFYRRYTIDLGEELGGRKEFISQYDAIEFLREQLPKYDGKLHVTGNFEKDWYQDRYIERFKFQNVYAVDDSAKSSLTLSMDIYYNKDSIDKSEFKDTKKIFVDGYIDQYINSTEKNRFIPHQFVFCTTNYNPENEKHRKQYDFKIKFVDISNKKMSHMLWDIALLRGAEEAEFNETMLTDLQREQIELGFATLDDFKPKGTIFGDRINEYRLRMPILKGDFANGLVDTDMKQSEFEELVHVPTATVETLKIAEKKEEKETGNSAPFDLDEDDLFC